MTAATPPPLPDLETKSLAIALDAVARDDAAGGAVARRAFPASPANVEWNSILLRRVFEQRVAVYDPDGEIEVAIDRRGKLWSFDDPRHAPATKEVHRGEREAIASVERFLGGPIELEAEFHRRKDGLPFLRVVNRKPMAEKSKFFAGAKPAEPEGPPPDRIEAEVNADTGRVFRFRREPVPPVAPDPAKKGAKP